MDAFAMCYLEIVRSLSTWYEKIYEGSLEQCLEFCLHKSNILEFVESLNTTYTKVFANSNSYTSHYLFDNFEGGRKYSTWSDANSDVYMSLDAEGKRK